MSSARSFERERKAKVDGVKFYRVTQDGAEILFDKITKRKYLITLDELMFLANRNTTENEELKKKFPESQTVKNLIENAELGYLILYTEGNKKTSEIIIVKKIADRFSIMTSADHITGLKIKYEKDLDFLTNMA